MDTPYIRLDFAGLYPASLVGSYIYNIRYPYLYIGYLYLTLTSTLHVITQPVTEEDSREGLWVVLELHLSCLPFR